MDSSQFAKLTRRQASRVAVYITDRAPGMVVRKTLRFIDGNFRAQGWQGSTFQPWKPNKRNGTILVLRGRLRRGTQYSMSRAGEVRFYNNVKYADAHNRGYTGSVTVKAHSRAQYHKSKVFAVNEFTRTGRHKQRTVTTKTGEHRVKSYTRQMTLPKRQFAPYEGNDSPVLNNSISRELERDIKQILTTR